MGGELVWPNRSVRLGLERDLGRDRGFWRGLILLLVLLVPAGLIGSRVNTELFRSRERARLATALVVEQEARLRAAALEQSGSSLAIMKEGPLPLDQLGTRLVLSMLRTPTLPLEIEGGLKQAAASREWPGSERSTINLWLESLSRAMGNPDPELDRATEEPQGFLRRGRFEYFQAEGYRMQGRLRDAAPLFLRAAQLLAQFVRSPGQTADRELAEALYLIGASYLSLTLAGVEDSDPQRRRFGASGRGLALPLLSVIRGAGDRTLRVCSELYSGSIWANRANALWQAFHSSEVK